VHEPEAAPLAALDEGSAEGAEAAAAAQIPDLGPDAKREVDWKPLRQLLAAMVRHTRARLAAGIGTRAAPATLAQGKEELDGRPGESSHFELGRYYQDELEEASGAPRREQSWLVEGREEGGRTFGLAGLAGLAG